MKILAINGSHRGNRGHTGFLISKVASGVEKGGAEFEAVHLASLKINHCISCGKCNSPDHYLKCVYEDKDDMKSVLDKMIDSDIIIFATPIYVFTMTGLLKNFLDRLYSTADVFDLQLTKSGLFFHHLNPDICSKPLVTLICCDNTEKETPQNAISYFRTYARFQDAPIVGELVRNAGRFAAHGKNPDMFQIAPKLKDSYDAFESAGMELAKYGRISKATQKTASQDILPFPPWIRLLKNLMPVKRKILAQARMFTQYKEGDV